MMNERSRDIGEFIPGPDDDMVICRCEEITKGEIRRAVHDGMFTMQEIRRYLRAGMGLCQGQTCSKLVKGMLCHVNLIPVNEIKENTLKRPSKKNILEFEEILKDNGIEVTVRREMGTDINAACGQLRRSYLEENK